MRPAAPYPNEDEAPVGPAWVGFLPTQTAVVDESTTEVPLVRPVAGTSVPERAQTAQRADASAEPSAEGTVELRQPAGAGNILDGQVQDRVAATSAARTAQATDGGHPAEAAVDGQPPATPPAPAPTARPEQRPGDVAEDPIAVWSEDAVGSIRERWRDLQIQFIDDPDAAVRGARSLITDTVRTLSDRLLAERDTFDPHQGTDRPDTEAMRVAMRRYREFLDRVLAL